MPDHLQVVLVATAVPDHLHIVLQKAAGQDHYLVGSRGSSDCGTQTAEPHHQNVVLGATAVEPDHLPVVQTVTGKPDHGCNLVQLLRSPITSK